MPLSTKSLNIKGLKHRQNIVLGINFSLKKRSYKLKNTPENYLNSANKYIFVQDFDKAEAILRQLTRQHPDDYEILFRRVEVSSKRDTLPELIHEFKKLCKDFPLSKAIEFANILAKIRLLNQNDTKKDKFNPPVKQAFEVSKNIDNVSNNRMPLVSILSNKKIRINRTLDIPDDYIAEENPHFEMSPQEAETKKDKLNSINPDSKEDLLAKTILLQEKHPENYAAWYIAGCALECNGKLSEAIEKWDHAFKLNSKSTSILTTLTELQQLGVIPENSPDYSEIFESLDKYLVHGHFETHTSLYNEFINSGDHKNAIGALKTLADWLQKQYGEVPIEVEILCLLGAMQAYKLGKNQPAAEACRSEVENLVIACKKSPRDMNQISFIAQLCEEYGLKSVARICYFAILISKDASLDLIIQTASHCVSSNPSDGLLECLKVAYKNTHGSAEVRFCLLLCGLKIEKVDISEYMLKKNKIRELITNDAGNPTIFPILEELFAFYNFDPEVNYYLGEIHSKNSQFPEAKKYFKSMFSIDYFNTDGTLRYIFFLLKSHDYNTAREVAQEALTLATITEQQANEMHWSIAAAFYSEGGFEKTHNEILKSLENDPWNHSYLVLYLRANLNIDGNEFLKEKEIIIKEFEESLLGLDVTLLHKNGIVEKLIAHGNECLRSGFSEYAWVLAKCAILISENINEPLLNFLARAGAGYNARTAVQQILLLLRQKNGPKEFHFGTLSTCIAQIYSFSGDWPLVDEWLSISKNNRALFNKVTKPKLFELEALSIAMKGSDLKRAQNLLEAAMDAYDNIHKVPLDTKVLHGYILVAQGQFSAGIEKMQNNISTNASVQSLYFLVKGLERAGQLNNTTKETLSHLFQIYPTNTFEQRMIEEIFYTVGTKNPTSPVGLAC
ncbi:tetratricopeptide repeat protein [Fluviispira multicolorata]|uniref:Tetratricopeptide repeat protein n=1 Tax=Fluviispira multicolorata TaxID=2654512 RepID=A0A833JCR5_9BACT|nr:tetratricopeptide repeat protein [Fluviispira multicolorata]KAB8027407.1 hypothetical protein GCL57_14520 [Fluviispira multicolorata]